MCEVMSHCGCRSADQLSFAPTAGDQGDEKRVAMYGEAYTLAEFVEFYRDDAQWYWDQAKSVQAAPAEEPEATDCSAAQQQGDVLASVEYRPDGAPEPKQVVLSDGRGSAHTLDVHGFELVRDLVDHSPLLQCSTNGSGVYCSVSVQCSVQCASLLTLIVESSRQGKPQILSLVCSQSTDRHWDLRLDPGLHDCLHQTVYPQVSRALQQKLGACFVVPFSHVVRRCETLEPMAEAKTAGPFRSVHNDYTLGSARTKAARVLSKYLQTDDVEHVLTQVSCE